MEQNRRIYVLIAGVGVLAILLSTCLGAVAGGATAYWTVRTTGRRITQQCESTLRECQRLQRRIEVPQPFQPEYPPFVPETGGALITRVVEDGPADRAGIRTGDVITSVDGLRIDEEETLKGAISRKRPGDRVEIMLFRDGQERTITVRLAEHPEEEGAPYLGVFYEMLPVIQPEGD